MDRWIICGVGNGEGVVDREGGMGTKFSRIEREALIMFFLPFFFFCNRRVSESDTMGWTELFLSLFFS